VGDGGRPSVLLSQLPRSQSALLRFLPQRPPRFQPGDPVPGTDFDLEVLLGQGGFGEVWLGRHVRRKNAPARAFKFCLDAEMAASLEREVELLDRIEAEVPHEGIVQLLATSLRSDPPFLMYEYVDGGDLVGWLASFDGKRPAPEAVVKVLRQAAEALAFAHEQGIVHRDLKPANLLLTREGRVKVGDFGIGAVVSEVEGRREQSRVVSGMSLLRGSCTPLYAPREQRRGEAVDARADVYALGVVGYQLLMGDVTLELSHYWRDELEELELPAGLLEVLSGCLARPDRRLKGGRAVLEELERIGGRGAASGEQRAASPQKAAPAATHERPAPVRQAAARPAAQQELRPGEARRIALPGGADLDVVWVPGGTFWMGASPGDQVVQDSEKPRHQVKLEGYWLGKFPVTQAQWKSVMGTDPSGFKGEDRPVENVSWEDAQEFLKKAGQGLRLPSEAEWEYACRARTEGPWYGELAEVAWYGDNSGRETHPVGRKKANGWGLHDMLGNVWEWCEDAGDNEAYKKRQGVTVSPVVKGDKAAVRVLRGGSWANGAGYGRASHRHGVGPGRRSESFGFRVARSGRREPEALDP
jgi:eukaryotic-like serine/threonine-protein kinase